MSALEARSHLLALLAERGDAPDDPTYLAELDEEIEDTRQVYTCAAVTEIASLRAELWGPLRG